ncbi:MULTISPECIES: TrmB family transcriptional regulator [unclassified Halorubrum]|uniref:TrmB family transcriptional regulator n=1 Tax=unclassified Halorubrum TaxID=2642239 RepID=UPI000B985C81|nr:MULTISPECIES: TrmB family transcriptional regulator [unclassified Halorubrum]OYR46128.1 transcriptional regulator [Halorubrum sp. Hd13]OYR48342.1 transcriptional regulator [Halorubrum sp. Ea8]OYR50667.1 transcriptional regulator [Halorubrum sp. Ea1]
MASLRDLGLSEYEARAYRALLRTGPTTAKDLSRASEVPMGRVYDVLNSLEQHNLVRSQAASRPKKYAAVEPDAALDRLLDEKKRELETQVEQYEEVVADLSTELDAGEPVDGQFWTAAVGAEEATDLLLERIAAAERRMVVVVGAPATGFDLGTIGEQVAAELESALERGVEIRVLLSPETVDALPRSVGRRYTAELSNMEGFEVRTTAGVDGTFNVFDGIEVCIEVPHPLSGDEPFAMIDVKDAEFATSVSEEFEPRWAESDPLSFG